MDIMISMDTLKGLIKDSNKLAYLECGGVDNWSWYGESLNPEGEKSYYDLEDEIDSITNEDELLKMV